MTSTSVWTREGAEFRVVGVDAIGQAAARFYGHFGFTPVPDRPSRMVIHLTRVADALRMNAQDRH